MGAAVQVGRFETWAAAVALGAAMACGYGCAPAWADEPSPASAHSATESEQDSAPTPAPDTEEPSTTPDSGAASDTDPDGAVTDTTVSTSTGSTVTQAPPGVVVSTGGADTAAQDPAEPEVPEAVQDGQDGQEPVASEPTVEPTAEPAVEPTAEPAVSVGSGHDAPSAPTAAPTATSTLHAAEVRIAAQPEPATAMAQLTQAAGAEPSGPEPSAVAPSSTVAAPAVTAAAPAVHYTSTAPQPSTVVGYLGSLLTGLAKVVLSPFAAGLPALPADPSPWTLLAWVRREFFNGSPTIDYHAAANIQTVTMDNGVATTTVTGNIGASDPDGDPLTYTVIGRPRGGGTVEVDQDGNFTYRPMNAMAAVGGTDTFTVAVDDEAAGLHVHGLLGLLQFVPILGNVIQPGGGHGVTKKITVTVDPVAGVDLSFPQGFHWGVAESGFQTEGGPGAPVDPNSDWYAWVHDRFNQALGLTNGVPENGPGTYVTYDADAQLARDELGMNTFRTSIEWSRIFPNSTAAVDISDEGGVVSLADLQALDALANQDEVAHYRDVFASMRANGLEPLITVNHFTLPSWVHDPTSTRVLAQLGLPAPAAGWLSDSTPAEFEKYAAYVAWKYGDQVDNWTVLNEPVPPILTQFLAIPTLVPSWPPGTIRPDLAARFLVNEANGYVGAYDAIHTWDTTGATAGQPAAFVGFANNMIPARPANPVNPLDVQAADAWNAFYNRWFPNAVIDGWVDANMDGIKTADEIHPEMAGKADFIGIQYYGSQPMQGFGLPLIPGFAFLQGLPVRCSADSPTCSDFNQPTDPGGFREVLDVAASYGKPLWVTENGIADAGDSKRPSYLTNHIAVVQDEVAHGMDIRGYTYWSFVDNLEWADGYGLQFGLYGSDPTTPELERTPKPDSIAAISAITTANALPVDLLQTYVPGAV